jgi:membrane protein DedA with SNARE-associated domain
MSRKIQAFDSYQSICYTATMLPLEQSILDFINAVYTAIQWPGVVAMMAIESACIPLPSEIIMPLAGWMLIKEPGLPAIYNLAAGAYGALGCTIGSLIAYVVGIKGGRPFLERYGKYVLISRHDLDTADRWFARNGDWAIFITRLLPVVRTFISLPAGIARMRPVKFILYTFVGSLVWCAALSFGGYLLGEHWEDLRRVMRPFDPVIIAVILVLVGYYIYRHVKHFREGERESGKGDK